MYATKKSNEALRGIADTGGVIGVVASPACLTTEPSATIEHMLDHINQIASRVGLQHLAKGTAQPLQASEEIQEAALSYRNRGCFCDEDRLDVTKRLIGLGDCRNLPSVTRALVRHGYSNAQVQGILGQPALRAFAAGCG